MTDKICKIRCYLVAGILLIILCAGSAIGNSGAKEILTPAERTWLTANQSRIVLAVETGYAPFVFIDSKDQPKGLAHDYMLLLEAKLGVNFKQRRFSSLDDIFAKVRSGDVHIVNAVTKTARRSEFLSFTEPFIRVPNVIVVRKERTGQMREGDLKGLKVSLVKSYAVTEQLTKTEPYFELDLVPDDLTGLFNVSFGRSDATVIDLATASYLIAQKGITNLRVAGETGADIQLAMGVPSTETTLHGIIQKGLDSISEAERQNIRTQWINTYSRSIFSDRRFWYAAAGLFSVICSVVVGILLWNRTLRRQVALRTEDLTAEKELLRQSEYTLQEQNEELQVNEEELRVQNDDLQATEEMLRVQISEYEASQKLLKESYERFRALHEASFGGVFVHENGVILECNQGLSEMTGYSVEELIGMQSIQLIPEEYQEEVAIKIREGFSELYEVEGIRKDGTRYHVRIRGKSIFYMGRSVRVTDMRDITDRKRAEEEHKQLEHKFHQAQKLESLGVLAGGIAHDFNNILTVIMGHCYMAREDMIPEHQFKAAFQKIETAGSRAKDLCRQMLTYAGKSPMEQTQFNLWLLVDEVVKMLQAAIKKNVTIMLDLKCDVPEINGDTGQIQQIIMNFIINSVEAIGDVNGKIRVVLTNMVFEKDGTETDTFGTVIKAGAYACLEVSDTGCGMDEATQKLIFEPFFTTKSTGRGLGMSAIHGIIKSHGGALQLTSKPGVGTTFKVFFPIPPASDYAATSLKTTVLIEDASGTILLVEDEELLRVMGKELLGALGFTTMTASNGSEALEIYRERGSEIDVILLDLVMPVMGGIETYQELRRISQIVPIIICSGFGVESIENVIENDPHAGFMHKPYNPGELRDMLVRMMK